VAQFRSAAKYLADSLQANGHTAHGTPRVGGLKGVRWLAVLLPALFVMVFEFARHQWLGPMLPFWLGHGWQGNLVGSLVVAGTVYGFVHFFARMIQRSTAETTRAREEAAVIVERQRIAREMHDRVAQTLFYLTVKLREVDGSLPPEGAETAREELREAQSNLKETYGQVREVVADLKRQADLEDLGEAVRRAVRDCSQRFGLRVECRIEGELELPAASRVHFLAIVQEALANAKRHGGVRRASVLAKKEGRHLIVEVADEGAGFDPECAMRNGGYGLTIMAERARIIGGELLVDSAPGRGTRVTVRVPEGGG
jgi:signal transduction histidine kinase